MKELLHRAEALAGISGGNEDVWRNYILPLDAACARARKALGMEYLPMRIVGKVEGVKVK